jgi:hypothetical protein
MFERGTQVAQHPGQKLGLFAYIFSGIQQLLTGIGLIVLENGFEFGKQQFESRRLVGSTKECIPLYAFLDRFRAVLLALFRGSHVLGVSVPWSVRAV